MDKKRVPQLMLPISVLHYRKHVSINLHELFPAGGLLADFSIQDMNGSAVV
jgi:hypothetical protein